MSSSSAAPVAGEYDYLVIGAGSAGCAVAGRLAEDPTVRVAVIENGGADDHYLIWTPIGLAKTVVKPGPYNYGYYTEPQPALGGRTSYQPRGRVLGGSSSLNGMVYIRGHRKDYDDWAALGCHGWSYDDVLPYFRRSENNTRFAGTDNLWHGTARAGRKAEAHACHVRRQCTVGAIDDGRPHRRGHLLAHRFAAEARGQRPLLRDAPPVLRR